MAGSSHDLKKLSSNAFCDSFPKCSHFLTFPNLVVTLYRRLPIATTKQPRNSTNYKMSENLQNKILKIHVNAGCASAQKILITFQGLGQQLKAKEVNEIISKCTLCNNIENFSHPRKSAPGVISKEESCQCTIFIDHKKIITQERLANIRENNSSADPDFRPESNSQSCLTVFEPVSGTVWFKPVSDYQTDSVKDALRMYFMINGPTKNVVSDNALSFTSLKKWLKDEFQCELHHTSVYHPNSNLSERARYRSFEKVLRTYDEVEKEFKYENWEDALTKTCSQFIETHAIQGFAV